MPEIDDPRFQEKIERTEFKWRIEKATPILVNAQLNIALGESELYVIRKEIDEDGKEIKHKAEIVDDKEEVLKYLSGEYEDSSDEYYYITRRRADNKAIDSLLNRAYGRAKEAIDITSAGKILGASDSDLRDRLADKILGLLNDKQ